MTRLWYNMFTFLTLILLIGPMFIACSSDDDGDDTNVVAATELVPPPQFRIPKPQEPDPWLNDSWIGFNHDPQAAPRLVRFIYFLPNDRHPQQEVVDSIRAWTEKSQTFFADQLEANGLGRLTFNVETEADGRVKVNPVLAEHPDEHYNECPFHKIKAELQQSFDLFSNVYVVVLDNAIKVLSCGGIDAGGKTQTLEKIGGITLIPENANWYTFAHELGHAFGLLHNFQNDQSLMSFGRADKPVLDACFATILSLHPSFNPDTPVRFTKSAMQKLSIRRRNPKLVSFLVRADAEAGLAHAMLYVMTMAPHPGAGFPELKDWIAFPDHPPWERVQFDFDGIVPSAPHVPAAEVFKNPVLITIIDASGTVREREFAIPQ